MMTDVALPSLPSATTAPAAPCAPTSPEPAREHADIAEPHLIARRAACRLAGGVCDETLLRALSRGEVRGRFIDGRWFFEAESVRRWAEARGPERRGRPPRRAATVNVEESHDGE
jgi:hypothetical protein